MSYKAWMTFRNEKAASNALAFETEEEARRYADDLLSRWTMPTGYEIRESDEPVNYRWLEGGGLQRIAPAFEVESGETTSASTEA